MEWRWIVWKGVGVWRCGGVMICKFLYAHGANTTYIDAEIIFEGKKWRFSGIYGEPKTDLRHRTWTALR
jgi:hypothetical protein